MRKTILLSFLAIALIFSFKFTSWNDDNTNNVLAIYDGPNWTNQSDTGITCTPGGIANDDGTFENGYRSVSTGDSTTFVHKMVMPTGGNVTISSICWAWTSSPAVPSLSHQLVVYDTTGPGGAPGNVPIAVINVTSTGIAAFPGHSRYSAVTNITGLNNRAYYIGVRWNNNPIVSAFTSADENSSTTSLGWQRNTTTFPPTWGSLPVSFPLYKNMSYRIEAISVPPPPSGNVTTICRGGINVPIIDNATVRDSLQVVLGSGCVITDVNVRIDTVLHTWDSDLTFTLNKGTTSVVIINQVGGSGDNFINTLLNDSATTPIASGVAPFTGPFKPSNPLTPFNFGAGLGDGFWRLSIADGSGGDQGFLKRWCVVITYNCPTGGIQTIEIPNYYSLSQNYPNPFNPSTSIKFTMPKGDNVKLVVFDMLGREVKTLVNEFRNSGTYEVNFDASVLSSGVYFYRLEAGDFSATKKMLLVK